MRISLLFAALLAACPAAAQIARPLPVVQRLEPTSGPAGTVVQVVGRHFDDAQTLWLGDVQLAVEHRLPNRWAVRIPENARSNAIEIRTARGNVNGPRFRVSEAPPAPTIAGFAPPRGAPGTEVVIRGEHFSPRLTENRVMLGDRAVVVQRATPTELTVIVPTEATAAPFSVAVTGAGSATSTESFALEAGTAITGFEPAIGPARSRVVLRGSGFASNAAHNRVFLGERRARVLRATPTELEVELPRDATSAPFLVEVRGGGRATSSAAFEVRQPPTIAALEPDRGMPSTRVTIRGANFGADVRQLEVKIGAIVLPIRELAPEAIVVEIPNGATSGPIDVVVQGLAPARSPTEFRVRIPVAVESFAPSAGPAGTLVTIRGRGFPVDQPNDVQVTLSGRAAEIAEVRETELIARMPEAASGPLIVGVAHAGEARTPRPFVVTRPPQIDSILPMTGAVGTEITIRGRNFGTRPGLIDVRIGERPLQVRRAGDQEIVAVIPPDAQTGPLRVTVRLQGSATSAQPFVVTAP